MPPAAITGLCAEDVDRIRSIDRRSATSQRRSSIARYPRHSTGTASASSAATSAALYGNR